MSVFYADESVTLHHGDALDVLAQLPDELRQAALIEEAS